MKFFSLFKIVLVFSSFISVFSQGYNIKIQIEGLKDTSLILGHHFNDKLFPDDTARVNSNGVAVFQGDEALPGGMYIILTSEGYFDILLDTDQAFEIKTKAGELIDKAEVSGSEDNEVFFAYQKFMMEMQRKSKTISDQKKDADEATKKALDEQLVAMSEKVDKERARVLDQYSHLFAGKFIRATKEIEVPEPPRDENGNIIDSSFQYKYYRNHFFDNMDPGDPRFLRTPLYEQKLLKYIDKVIPQIADTIILEVDALIEKSRASDELFRYMLITLFNHYAKSQIMGMDAVYLHIAEKYYIPEATWSDAKFIADLKETVATKKPLRIGEIAPDIELLFVPFQHFIDAENDTAIMRDPHVGSMVNLHSIPADYIILAFWEADCGHCKTSIPKLYKENEKELRDLGVQVIAVSTLGGIEGKEKWINFINKHELYEWNNCWNPYTYNHKVVYDIKTTPQYYILDKNKKIIAKRVGPEHMAEIIKYHKKTAN
jgi:peroxiredoxin